MLIVHHERFLQARFQKCFQLFLDDGVKYCTREKNGVRENFSARVIVSQKNCHGTFGTLVNHTADVSFSKDVFDKAVKSALGRVNTRGISNLTQHQSKALLNFLCGKDSFVCLPTGDGKSLIYQLEQKNQGCGCFRTSHNRGKILLLV